MTFSKDLFQTQINKISRIAIFDKIEVSNSAGFELLFYK
jgi:hypothetical protein